MVSDQSDALNSVFHALADPTRRAMLRALSEGGRTISELSAPCDMSFAAASKHVKALERAGLVSRRKQGRAHICRLEAAPLAEADAWLDRYRQYWALSLDALEAALNAEDAGAAARPATGGPGLMTMSRAAAPMAKRSNQARSASSGCRHGRSSGSGPI